MKRMRIRLARKILAHRGGYSYGMFIVAAKRLGYRIKTWTSNIFIVR